MTSLPTERTCKRCDTTKPFEEFVKSAKCIGGRSHICKACDNARRMEWDRTNAERAYERKRQWQLDNPDKVAAANVRWNRANPESVRERKARHRADAGEVVSGQVIRDVAVKRGAEFVEMVYPLILLEQFDGECGICGEDVDPLAFEVDHIIPCHQGGEHSYANTQPAHPTCNNRKAAAERERKPDGTFA